MIQPIELTADWAGDTVVILGNGTSLLSDAGKGDLARVQRAQGALRWRVFVTNSGYLTAPWADALMTSDRHWIKANPNLSGFFGPLILTTRPEAYATPDKRVRSMRRKFIEHARGEYFADPGLLVEGHNSVSTMISASILRGVARIILLGVDLTPGAGNKRRAQGVDSDDPTAAKARYARQVVHLTTQARQVTRRGVQVVNCSPRSALVAYPYSTLEEVIRA